jgi:hypothetical protein
MNLHTSRPRATTSRLGNALASAVLCLSLGIAAQAGQFFLGPEGGGVRYGPFEYQDGAKVVIAGRTFVLTTVAPVANGTELEKKLQAIILPTVELGGASIDLVVQFLQQRSTELDPAKKGIRIVLKLDGKPVSQIPLISFSAQQISMLETIRTVTQVAGLTYRIDGDIVFIEPK